MLRTDLEKEFHQRYNKPAAHIFFCPGRVNLIGEHIDYNGGQVMPCAVSRGTTLLIAPNNENKFRFQCLNFPETAEIPLQGSYTKTGKEWFNYPLGVLHELLQLKHPLSGMDMLFYGDLPIGAGLSSSASIEVVTAFAFDTLFQLGINRTEIALLAKRVENGFIGLNSGIMDQFAVARGKKDNAILLDCDTLEYEYIPFDIGEYVLAIINSRKQRALAESKYNERFSECRQALELLRNALAIDHLCDISPEIFAKHRHLIDNPILEKRAFHVITENERVKQARRALLAGDLKKFGKLMYASHESLKEDYEVSGKELDTIVEFAKSYDACIGSRMTGAGFGGCAIALVKKDQFDNFSEKLGKYYKDRIGYDCEVFSSSIGQGVFQM